MGSDAVDARGTAEPPRIPGRFMVFLIGVRLVDVRRMREIAALRRDEFAIALVTAVVVVTVGVEQGIVLAIVLSVLDHVRRHYRPVDAVVQVEPGGRMRRRGVTFAVSGANRTVRDQLDRYGLVAAIGADRVFPDVDEAIDAYHATGPD